MSRLVTNAITSTAASSDAITIDANGIPSFPNGGVGKLLQQVTATVETAQSWSSASYVDISGLTATINSVTSGTSIMVDIQLLLGRSSGNGYGFKLFRDSTFLPFASGEPETFAQYIHESGDNYQYGFQQVSFKFIDTHGQSAGSNLVYKLQGTTYSGSATAYINRRHYDSGLRGQSRITLTEIAP
tara:strand:+ start:963 stop:1520 length:558 start_codon:yes stop_codon:yes gene_type:complete